MLKKIRYNCKEILGEILYFKEMSLFSVQYKLKMSTFSDHYKLKISLFSVQYKLNMSLFSDQYKYKCSSLNYIQGVPHQLDRVNGSKLRFRGQIRKFKKNESFEKFNKANRNLFWQKMLDFSSIMCVFWC